MLMTDVHVDVHVVAYAIVHDHNAQVAVVHGVPREFFASSIGIYKM